MATKSQVIRGMLFGAEFLTELYKEVIKLGGNEEMMFEAMKTGSGFAKKTAGLIVVVEKKIVVASNILRIPAGPSLTDRIALGKYDWVNSDITEEHFPMNIPVAYDVEYKLFHFGRDISSENAIKEMKKEGFQPATLPELLVLGETQPELQKEFPIVALGLMWRYPYGHRHVPLLYWRNVWRKLDLDLFEHDWDGFYRFLALRK